MHPTTGFTAARAVTIVAGLAALTAACSSSKGTPAPAAPTLPLSRVSIAVVPGGSETITVQNRDGSLAAGAFVATSSDDAVATVTTVIGPRVTIAGQALGKANVTVRDAAGVSRVLPVQVYDNHFMDTGELVITYTDAFQKVQDLPEVMLNDADLLVQTEVVKASIWRATPPAGFHAVGDFMINHDRDGTNPNGSKAVMVVKAKEGSAEPLRLTAAYDLVYTIQWSSCARGAKFWRPRCDAGYQAMGLVTTPPGGAAPAFSTPCLRQDLTIGGAVAPSTSPPEPILQTSRNEVLGFWSVRLPDAPSHARAYLPPGTFVIASGTAAPTFDPAIHVLNVQLPMLAEAPPQDLPPRLTGFLSPGDGSEAPPRFAKAMLVPCSLVNDVLHGSIPWRVANSPFYRLERHVFYKLVGHNYNTSTVMQPYAVHITAGVTASQTETFRSSTNVTISAEAGIELKDIFSAKVSTTVSREFGYDTETSIEQLTSRTDDIPFYANPGKAAAVWQEWNRYVLLRHEGTGLTEVAAWDFGVYSWVTDDYPD
jgi:hypothetical protein